MENLAYFIIHRISFDPLTAIVIVLSVLVFMRDDKRNTKEKQRLEEEAMRRIEQQTDIMVVSKLYDNVQVMASGLSSEHNEYIELGKKIEKNGQMIKDCMGKYKLDADKLEKIVESDNKKELIAKYIGNDDDNINEVMENVELFKRLGEDTTEYHKKLKARIKNSILSATRLAKKVYEGMGTDNSANKIKICCCFENILEYGVYNVILKSESAPSEGGVDDNGQCKEWVDSLKRFDEEYKRDDRTPPHLISYLAAELAGKLVAVSTGHRE